MIDDPEFGAFMREELPGLLRFAHLVTGDPHAAEEAVQASLVATLRRWPKISQAEGFRPVPYVRRAIVNNHIRSARRWSNRVRLGPVPDEARPDDVAAWIEHDQLVQALRTLPPRQRAVLVLRYYADLSEAEIAQFIGCRPGTVKSAAARGLATLRMHLDPSHSPATNGGHR
ncbi:MAG: SigE family RNA polymerase sigma factor [Actinomycetota bacterium]